MKPDDDVKFSRALQRKLGPTMTRELEALATVMRALEVLPLDARARIVLLAIQKCGITGRFSDAQLMQLLRVGSAKESVT